MKSWNLGYRKSKEKAKGIYSKIGHIKSPALGDELVAFTSAGFNHLVRKGRIPRTKSEQKRRFALISHIEAMVKNPHATILYLRRDTKVIQDRHGNKELVQSVASFWTFIENVKGKEIKVVIRQLGTGAPKHFFSVMEGRKIKKPPK